MLRAHTPADYDTLVVGLTEAGRALGPYGRPATLVMRRAFPRRRGGRLHASLQICYNRPQASDSTVMPGLSRDKAPRMPWCPSASTRRACGGYEIISLSRRS